MNQLLTIICQSITTINLLLTIKWLSLKTISHCRLLTRYSLISAINQLLAIINQLLTPTIVVIVVTIIDDGIKLSTNKMVIDDRKPVVAGNSQVLGTTHHLLPSKIVSSSTIYHHSCQAIHGCWTVMLIINQRLTIISQSYESQTITSPYSSPNISASAPSTHHQLSPNIDHDGSRIYHHQPSITKPQSLTIINPTINQSHLPSLTITNHQSLTIHP